MVKSLVCLAFFLSVVISSIAQHRSDSTTQFRDASLITFKINDNTNCLYNLKLKYDLPIIGLGIAGALGGNLLIGQKTNIDSAVVANLTPDDTEFPWDKSVTHNYSPEAGHASDFFLYGSMA